MQLLILAAGMGSRFGGLKQMEPMDEAGNFLLDYSVYDAKRAGFDSVVFVIKHSFEKEFKETIGKRVEKIIKTEYAFQDLEDIPEGFKVPEGREKPWGTAHAIYAARDLIRENFIMINGDDFYGRDAYEVAYKFLASLPKNSAGKYANVAFKVSNTMTENGSVKRGVCFEDNDHNLTKLVESSIERNKEGKIIATPLEGGEPFEVGEDEPVSMNLFCFNKDLIDHLRARFPEWLKEHGNELKSEYLIPSVVDELVHEGKASLKLLSTDSVWFGVTYKEDKPGVVKALKELVKKGEYKEGLY
ncbi:MAG: NTP transferase domain-containing protein [Bacilli bacterium]|nr:NTP transferase domain-containing protein [Bacilli bacterium]